MKEKAWWPDDYININVKDLLYMWFDTQVAFVKSLYPILGKEKTLNLLKAAVEKTAGSFAKGPYYHGPEIKSFADFGEMGGGLFASIITRTLDPTMELVQKTTVIPMDSMKQTRTTSSFKITRCLWSEIFKDLGAPEVGYAVSCNSDFARTRSWNPKLKLKRTQTIMEGAPYCDFCYVWEE
jgi:hypothetical protein